MTLFRSIQGEVVLFAGCKDNQTSADAKVKDFGATGACTFAFIKSLSPDCGDGLSYLKLLTSMKTTVRGIKHNQIVQMSTNFETNMDTPFVIWRKHQANIFG